MEKVKFSPQNISVQGLRFSMLIAALHSLLFTIVMCVLCIFQGEPVPMKALLLILLGIIFVYVMTFIGITAAYTHSIYIVKGNRFIYYNGFYPFPIRLPIAKIYRVQPVKNRRVFLDNRIGLRLYLEGGYCLLPYHIDVYVQNEEVFIHTLLHINPNIVITDEVITAWRIAL